MPPFVSHSQSYKVDNLWRFPIVVGIGPVSEFKEATLMTFGIQYSIRLHSVKISLNFPLTFHSHFTDRNEE